MADYLPEKTDRTADQEGFEQIGSGVVSGSFLLNIVLVLFLLFHFLDLIHIVHSFRRPLSGEHSVVCLLRQRTEQIKIVSEIFLKSCIILRICGKIITAKEDEKMDQVRGSQSIVFAETPYIVSAASVAGRQEEQRTLGEVFEIAKQEL